jgi:outer membrane protein OmpA-like peptidoglycan-associated protein
MAPAVATPAVAGISQPDEVDSTSYIKDSSPEMIPWHMASPGKMGSLAANAVQSYAAPDISAAYSNPELMSWQQHEARTMYNAAGYTLLKDSALKALDVLWRVPGVIYYDLNSYVPQDQEWCKLDSIFLIWKADPGRIIVVNGHTDIIGTERYNLSLSKNRAVYIRECLLSRGVNADNIKINYFGSTRPVWIARRYSLETDRDIFIRLQGVNRRCEIKIQ